MPFVPTVSTTSSGFAVEAESAAKSLLVPVIKTTFAVLFMFNYLLVALSERTNVVDQTPNRVNVYLALGTERRRVNLLLEKKLLLAKTTE